MSQIVVTLIRLPVLVLLGLLAPAAAHADELDDAYQAHLQNRFAEAVESYTAAMASGKLSAEERHGALVNRGSALSANGEYPAAIVDFTSALELKPNSPHVYYNRGVNYFITGNFRAAVDDFARAVELEPGNLYSIIWSYLAQRRSAMDTARTNLAAHTRGRPLAEWPGPVITWYLDQRSLEELVSDVRDESYQQQVAKTCEVGFYVGQRLLLESNQENAQRWLATAVAACKPSFVEHTASRAELARLNQDLATTGAPSPAASSARSATAAQASGTPAGGDTAPSASPIVYMQTRASVNLRSGPGSSHTSLGALDAGTRVVVLDETRRWVHVREPSGGREGFVYDEFLVPSHGVSPPAKAARAQPAGQERVVTTAAVNLRVGPGTHHRRLGTLAPATPLVVTRRIGEWLEVKADAMGGGFVHGDFVESTTAHGALAADPESAVRSYVTTAFVNYRTGPGSGYQSLGRLEKGTTVWVDGEVGGWKRVRLANGLQVFVHNEYLRVLR